jgi:hypothetical protein
MPDSTRKAMTGPIPCHRALSARPEMKPRTLRSGIRMRDAGSAIPSQWLAPSGLSMLRSGARPSDRQGRCEGDSERRASVSFVFPASLAVMMGPGKA